MICYRDMSFCGNAHSCAHFPCERRLTEAQQEQANKLGLPVCLMSMKDTCKNYKEKECEEHY